MSKRKYSEAEMIGAPKQLEAGRTAADVGRELGVSKHTTLADPLFLMESHSRMLYSARAREKEKRKHVDLCPTRLGFK